MTSDRNYNTTNRANSQVKLLRDTVTGSALENTSATMGMPIIVIVDHDDRRS